MIEDESILIIDTHKNIKENEEKLFNFLMRYKSSHAKELSTYLPNIGKIKLILNSELIRANLNGECTICFCDKTVFSIVDCCTQQICIDCLKQQCDINNIKCPYCKQKINKIAITEIIKTDFNKIVYPSYEYLQKLFNLELLFLKKSNEKNLENFPPQDKLKTTKISENFNAICRTQIFDDLVFTNIKLNKISDLKSIHIPKQVKILVNDVSGSMSYEIKNLNKRTINEIIAIKNTINEIGIITFSDFHKILFDITSIDDNNFNQIKMKSFMRVEGCTFTNEAIKQVIKMITNHKEINNDPLTIYICQIITDGVTSDIIETRKSIKLLKSLNVIIKIIGTGNQFSYQSCLDLLDGDPSMYEYLSNVSDYNVNSKSFYNIQVQGNIIDPSGDLKNQNYIISSNDDVSYNEITIISKDYLNFIQIGDIIIDQNHNQNITKNSIYQYFNILCIQYMNNINNNKDNGQYNYLQLLYDLNKLKNFIIKSNQIFINKTFNSSIKDKDEDSEKQNIFNNLEELLDSINIIIKRTIIPITAEYVDLRKLSRYKSLPCESNLDSTNIGRFITESRSRTTV
jgi:uncharacterized protein YegL